MTLVAAVTGLHYVFMVPLVLLSVFLMLVILVQRGRGGGLTGALGGMGGQSAFGTKAGDLFTRITIVVAAVWVLLALACVKFLNVEGSRGGLNAEDRAIVLPPAKTDGKAPEAKLPDGKLPDAQPAASDAGKNAPPADAPQSDAAKSDAAKSDTPAQPAAPAPVKSDDAAKTPNP